MNAHVPLRSILLATNLDDMEWLFPFTCSLAEESSASITLLYVVTSIRGMTVDQGCLPYYGPAEAINAAKEQLQSCCTRASCASRLRYEVLVIEGTPADGILATARQMHADLLVMGTRSRRGIERWLRGSVAETVLRTSPIPVITVGPNARKAAATGRPVKSILLATGLKGRSNEAARLTHMWTERLHGRMILLHIALGNEMDRAAQERNCRARENELRGLLAEEAFHEGHVEAQIRTGRASREILAAGAHVDLIVLGAVRTPIFERLAPEGTLYQVLAEARCPVASLHSEHVKKRPM
jgi:nucleotide-binding universal stress UspA family protein